MANNRMFLTDTKTGKSVMLAKYYPSTGWYVKHDDLVGMLDELFIDTAGEGSLGYKRFELEFEVEPDEAPKAPEVGEKAEGEKP